MKIEGSWKLAAPRETVFRQLMDPRFLARSLPGCEKLDPLPDGSYQATLKIGVGAMKGTYQGRVEIVDALPPESFRIKVEGKGAGGFVKGEGKISLTAENGETLLNYTGEAQVGGVIASVGQRMIQAAARQIVDQFFAAFSRTLLPSPASSTPSGGAGSPAS